MKIENTNNVRVSVVNACGADTCKCKGKSKCGKKKKTKKTKTKSVQYTSAGEPPKRYLTNSVYGSTLVRDNTPIILGNRDVDQSVNNKALEMYHRTYQMAMEHQQRVWEENLNEMRAPTPQQATVGVQAFDENNVDTQTDNETATMGTQVEDGDKEVPEEEQMVVDDREDPNETPEDEPKIKPEDEASTSKRKLACPKCNGKFKSKHTLTNHLKGVHNVKYRGQAAAIANMIMRGETPLSIPN